MGNHQTTETDPQDARSGGYYLDPKILHSVALLTQDGLVALKKSLRWMTS